MYMFLLLSKRCLEFDTRTFFDLCLEREGVGVVVLAAVTD